MVICTYDTCKQKNSYPHSVTLTPPQLLVPLFRRKKNVRLPKFRIPPPAWMEDEMGMAELPRVLFLFFLSSLLEKFDV